MGSPGPGGKEVGISAQKVSLKLNGTIQKHQTIGEDGKGRMQERQKILGALEQQSGLKRKANVRGRGRGG